VTWAVLAAALAACGVLAALPPRVPVPRSRGRPPPSDDLGWMRRGRWLWTALAAAAGASFVSGPAGLPAALLAGWFTWRLVTRAEPPMQRRRREAVARDLPGLVHLLATALESGCDVGEAVRLVCEVLPGPAADALVSVPARLGLGVDATEAWRPVLDDTALAPLGRAMVRAQRSGSSVTSEVARLADELGERARLRVEERARTVGVKAAVPLGVCLLPSFVLIGIVPLVVGLMSSLHL
jgi:Flp pilus assembly protein TadB